MSRNQMKMIALITMVVDHVGCRFVYMDLHPVLYYFLRGIGRLTFPIICFLLVQGMYHTRNPRHYLVRLCGFALLSEIPYDFFLSGKLVDLSVQNVFFTLAISLIVIELIDRMQTTRQLLKMKDGEGQYTRISSPYIKMGISFCVIGAGMALAWWLRTDYSLFGVLMVLAFYLFQRKDDFHRLFPVFACICAGQGILEMAAVLALPLIYFYQPEKKGGKTVLPGMFFYWLYPLHLVVLGVLRGYISPV